MDKKLSVLSLQPYYGGSHQQFNDEWAKSSRFEWTTIGLPARHWKWRMRHSGLYFAAEISMRVLEGARWDIIVCSDMLSVAELKGFLPKETSNDGIGLPIIAYFHENQFAYPIQQAHVKAGNHERDFHFSFTNFTSAVAADQIWFNSKFNFESMMVGLEAQKKRWPDHAPVDAIDSLTQKSKIQSPGINRPTRDWKAVAQERCRRRDAGEAVHLVWAGRWEHDKNPDDLLAALRMLKERGLEFGLSVIGESFRKVPAAFGEIEKEFGSQIDYWGYQESRTDYWNVLARGDVFVSTAIHEFFGIAAAEAISAGLFPILPDRLAYPGLLEIGGCVPPDSDRHLFEGSPESLVNGIESFQRIRMSTEWIGTTTLSEQLCQNLRWARRACEMDDELEKIVQSHRDGKSS
jgi:glycosyltransferase involved in cell wall biosynthesis